jgi:predicted transcriptional regulator
MSNSNAKLAKPYTLSELASHYGVTLHTMKRWIAPHKEKVGEIIGRIYTVRQVETIFQALGVPPALDELND